MRAEDRRVHGDNDEKVGHIATAEKDPVRLFRVVLYDKSEVDQRLRILTRLGGFESGAKPGDPY